MSRSGSPRNSPNLSRRALFRGAGGTAVTAAVAAAVPPGTLRQPEAVLDVAPVVRIGTRPAPPGSSLIRLTVNETQYELSVDARWTLGDVLRDQLGLTGTKIGCDRGECGACTVILDDAAVLACTVLALEAQGRKVTTVEGLTPKPDLSELQKVFWEAGGVQCGFCTPGMLMSAKALLDRVPKPTEEQVRFAISGNLCRCTGYTKIVEAILKASGR